MITKTVRIGSHIFTIYNDLYRNMWFSKSNGLPNMYADTEGELMHDIRETLADIGE